MNNQIQNAMKNDSIRVGKNRRPISGTTHGIYKISLWFRIVLETFLRSRMGKRYYSFRQALLMLFVMLCRVAFSGVKILVNSAELPRHYFLKHYGSFLLFMLCFLIFAIIRKIEAMRNKGYSLDMGIPWRMFYQIKFRGWPLTPRVIETIAEPLFCFCIGLGLWLLAQPVGTMLMVCSVFYAISYACAYKFADEAFMDLQDAQIRGNIIRDNTAYNPSNDQQKNSTHLPDLSKPNDIEDAL